MAKEMYFIYNELTKDYSLGHKSHRCIKDNYFVKISDAISHLIYEVNTKKIKSRRKIKFITNAPKEDFEKLKEELEKKLKNITFIKGNL